MCSQSEQRREFIVRLKSPSDRLEFRMKVQTLGKTLNIQPMPNTNTLIRATVNAGIELLRPRSDGLRSTIDAMSTAPFASMDSLMTDSRGDVARDEPSASIAASQPERRRSPVVPMRSLGPAHRSRIERHLLALDAHDRYLRFGFSASDEQVSRYVAGLDFVRDEIYGIYNRKLELVATAHLAFSSDAKCLSCAEFGVSVLAGVRGRGFGSRLFERALIHARNEGIDMLFIHALSENEPMLAIARKHGAQMQRYGSETEAHLKLAPADFESRVEEYIDDRVGDIDFEFKLQAKHFWDFLAAVQDIRRSLPHDS